MIKSSLTLLIILLGISSGAISQTVSIPETKTPDPKTAFLKSMALPGWGHYHVDKNNWTRGKYHLGADVALIFSYLGLSLHSNNLQQNWYSYGNDKAGVTIKDRSRQFQLAVGDFSSLAAYNDYHARSRNWDRLYEDRPENHWQWSNKDDRLRYANLRSRFEKIDQQLPAILGLMALNRVISGISAYNRAKEKASTESFSTLYVSPYGNRQGIVANFKVHF